jgi:hypothetical protein
MRSAHVLPHKLLNQEINFQEIETGVIDLKWGTQLDPVDYFKPNTNSQEKCFMVIIQWQRGRICLRQSTLSMVPSK